MSLLDRIEKRKEETPSRPGGTPAPAPSNQRSVPPSAKGAAAAAAKAAAGAPPTTHNLRDEVHGRLIDEINQQDDGEGLSADDIIQKIEDILGKVLVEKGLTLTRAERFRLVEMLSNDVLGLGPLEALLKDETITEIMINGPKQIYIEQKGKLTLSAVTFDDSERLMRVIDRIVSSIGRRVDESSPMVDARLADGSRVNVIIPPLALKGPTMTIRKFGKKALTEQDFLRFGTCTPDMMAFLKGAVRARMNVLVSGGTGSGKTTSLNLLSSFIPEDERIITVEDAAELQLQQDHVVTLESKPANVEGKGRITIRDLVVNCLRMRPDRIVVGECRGGEALDMLQAMNTGHDGSLTTVHANNPKDCLLRLETLVLMAGTDLPSKAIRDQIGAAIDIIVQQSRMRDGSRRWTNIAEVSVEPGGGLRVDDIFVFDQLDFDAVNNKVIGEHRPTGYIPRCYEAMKAAGEAPPETIFGARAAGRPAPAALDEPEPVPLAVGA